MDKKFKVGEKVHYNPCYGGHENGIVKEVRNKGLDVFVVYKCAADWANYTDYTAALTPIQHLFHGWK